MLKQAKNGNGLHSLLMELPERSNMEIALGRGYTEQEAKDYAEMLDWTRKWDSAISMNERYSLIEQMSERVRPLLANFNHPA